LNPLRRADVVKNGIATGSDKPVSLAEQLDYRYQIDIDGNGNAWNGCFWKMLTAESVVFKVLIHKLALVAMHHSLHVFLF
jgi:hypothetical protein